jgi:hypothetical protein
MYGDPQYGQDSMIHIIALYRQLSGRDAKKIRAGRSPILLQVSRLALAGREVSESGFRPQEACTSKINRTGLRARDIAPAWRGPADG